jgi:hypothetical protein
MRLKGNVMVVVSGELSGSLKNGSPSSESGVRHQADFVWLC